MAKKIVLRKILESRSGLRTGECKHRGKTVVLLRKKFDVSCSTPVCTPDAILTGLIHRGR